MSPRRFGNSSRHKSNTSRGGTQSRPITATLCILAPGIAISFDVTQPIELAAHQAIQLRRRLSCFEVLDGCQPIEQVAAHRLGPAGSQLDSIEALAWVDRQ